MKLAIVVANKNFRDEEFFDTKEIIEKNGIGLVVAAPEKKLATGILGGTVMPDISFSEVNSMQYDGLILVGGGGVFPYIENEEWHKIIKEFYDSGKLVAAICLAPAVLSAAGVLSGKRATINSAHADYLNKDIDYTGQDVEQDGNIITADGPAAATKFGQEIVNYFKK